jgi:hypothetical protein
MEVGGFEVIMGPLQERVEVRLFDRGIVLSRSGMTRSVYGTYEETYRFSEMQAADDGKGVWVSDETGARPARHVVGGAGRLLQKILGLLDPDCEQAIVAKPGHTITRFGLLVRGMVVGGPGGILLVPDGLYGLLPGGLIHVGMEDVERVERESEHIAVHTTSGRCRRLFLEADDLSLFQFAGWWARMLDTTCERGGPSESLPAVWVEQSGRIWRGQVDLVDGGIHLASACGTAELSSSGLMTHIVPPEGAAADDGWIRLQVRGQVHRLWLHGGAGHREQLIAHLAAHVHTSWRDDFDGQNWSECAGTWASVRVTSPGDTEVVLRNVRIEVSTMGLVLRHDQPPEVSLLASQVRRQVLVQLVRPRKRLRMRVIHRGVVREITSGETPHMCFRHALLPLRPHPELLPTRRAYFRVAAEEPILVELLLSSQKRPVRGEMIDLSATGTRIRLFEPFEPPAEMVRVRFPGSDHRMLQLRGEVLHSTEKKEHTEVGIRFAKLNEKVRTRVQREVLRLEREALQRKVDEEIGEEAVARGQADEPVREEPTLDYS